MERLHLGVDIIEISRIRLAIERWQERFLLRIFTETELNLYRLKIESLAVRFAGKEAVMKALNSSGSSISWRQIEIISDTSGKPIIRLYGNALKQLKHLGMTGLEVSLSHSRENAIALVIGLREG